MGIRSALRRQLAAPRHPWDRSRPAKQPAQKAQPESGASPDRSTGERVPGGGKGRGSNQSGLTLIEVLVSIVVLSIIIVPVFDGFMRGRMLVAHRGEKRMGLRLVERKVEQLLNAGYGSGGPDANILSLNVDPGVHPTDPSIVVNTRGDDDPGNDVMGELTWTVTPIWWSSPGDTVYAKTVDVKLRWPTSAMRDSVSASFMLGG
jgi:prepilin-type N-terminal cleavage/methylation domain-containing protein